MTIHRASRDISLTPKLDGFVYGGSPAAIMATPAT